MIKGYELLSMAMNGELESKTIVKTMHKKQYFDDFVPYDYYIYHNDNMFHRCNKDGKLGSKNQDRFLNYNTLQKEFEIEKVLKEDKHIPIDYAENRTPLEVYEYLRCTINKLIDKVYKE